MYQLRAKAHQDFGAFTVLARCFFQSNHEALMHEPHRHKAAKPHETHEGCETLARCPGSDSGRAKCGQSGALEAVALKTICRACAACRRMSPVCLLLFLGTTTDRSVGMCASKRRCSDRHARNVDRILDSRREFRRECREGVGRCCTFLHLSTVGRCRGVMHRVSNPRPGLAADSRRLSVTFATGPN